MSIVIEYYPQKATKEELRELLISHSFKKCDYFLKPFPKGSLYYSWFEGREYKSIDGLEAVIYQSPDDRDINNGWKLFTRTRVWASAYDKQKQNQLIKAAKTIFGGNFYNDAAGRNRFTKIDVNDFLTASESGIFQVYERVKSQLSKLSTAITDYQESTHFDISARVHKDILKAVKDNRPGLIIFNSLLPFLVSVMEHFFKELFVILIEFDKSARQKVLALRVKDFKEFNTIQDIEDIKNGSIKLEEYISRGFNFQNLEAVNSVFNKFLNIDIKKILNQRKRINRRNISLFEQLEELIERRHWMIHHFGFNTDVDKDKYIYFLNLTDRIVDTISESIEREKKLNFLKLSIYYGTGL